MVFVYAAKMPFFLFKQPQYPEVSFRWLAKIQIQHLANKRQQMIVAAHL